MKIALAGIVVLLVVIGGYYFFNKKGQPDLSNNPSQASNLPTGVQLPASMSPEKYAPYSPDTFNASSFKKRVYFFHAKWCPTCKVADKEFLDNIDKIPNDIIVFKTDYDTESELKKLYNITYQHTFVYVDNKGNEIKKWNGGGIAELLNNTK